MYNFKVINMNIPGKIFNELCFLAVTDAKAKLQSQEVVQINLKNGIFLCDGNTEENLTVANLLEQNLERKRYVKGIDYTINFFIKN